MRFFHHRHHPLCWRVDVVLGPGVVRVASNHSSLADTIRQKRYALLGYVMDMLEIELEI